MLLFFWRWVSYVIFKQCEGKDKIILWHIQRIYISSSNAVGAYCNTPLQTIFQTKLSEICNSGPTITLFLIRNSRHGDSIPGWSPEIILESGDALRKSPDRWAPSPSGRVGVGQKSPGSQLVRNARLPKPSSPAESRSYFCLLTSAFLLYLQYTANSDTRFRASKRMRSTEVTA